MGAVVRWRQSEAVDLPGHPPNRVPLREGRDGELRPAAPVAARLRRPALPVGEIIVDPAPDDAASTPTSSATASPTSRSTSRTAR